ncbi:alpha/beta hydrolase [Streptomyces sp. NPDC001978]|uniref:alpha/beta hydrolase n=1 Tax=Streptomyces sp. NPDC001978 TaxID=3364627 RepID=UPI0036D0FC54
MNPVRHSGRIPARALRGTVAVLSTCGLLLTACTTIGPEQASARLSPAQAPQGAADAASTSPVPPGLQRYYGQELHWKTCPGVPALQCTTVKAPLDYAHPDAGDITLAAVRKKATGTGATRIGSLLFNFGGPGSSPIEGLAADPDAYPSLNAAYDLVALDPRGVGHSTPVDCGSDTSTATTDSGVTTTSTDQDIEELAVAYAEIAAACARHAGRLLPHVGTLDAARDMDLMRALLGDEQLHYIGWSYGTYLGASYAELFPSRVGRMVLDGAVDPSLDAASSYLNQARGYQVAWEAFAADCAARDDCPVGHSVQEAGRTLDSLVARLNRTPLQQGKDITVDGGTVLYTTSVLLSAPNWPTLRQMLREVLAGDTTTLQKIYGSELPDNPGDQSLAAVNCLSSARGPRYTPEQAKAHLAEFVQVAPQFGESWSYGLTLCTSWPTPANQTVHPITAPGAAPILVVGTTRDPATPYTAAQALARQLQSGRLLTWDGDGHGAYIQGSTCIQNAVDPYLLDGRLPKIGTICTDAPDNANAPVGTAPEALHTLRNAPMTTHRR